MTTQLSFFSSSPVEDGGAHETYGEGPTTTLSLEEILGLPPPNIVAAPDAVRIDDVVERCSERELMGSMARSSIKFILEARHYRAAWDALTQWLGEATRESGSAMVGHVAAVSSRRYAMGIQIPVFALSEAFKQRYGVHQDASLEACPDSGTRARKCPRGYLSDLSGLEDEVAEFALEAIFGTIGELIESGESLDVDFGIGTLLVQNRMARFAFSQGRASPRRPGKPRRSEKSPVRRSFSKRGIAEDYGKFLPMPSTQVLPEAESSFSPTATGVFTRRQTAESYENSLRALAAEYERAKKNTEGASSQRPPLLDAHARLKAAVFSGSRDSPSANIARRYQFSSSAAAAEKTTNLAAGCAAADIKSPETVALSPRAQEEEAFREQEALRSTRDHIDASAPRFQDRPSFTAQELATYEYYVKHGVPDGVFDPIDPLVLQRAALKVQLDLIQDWDQLLLNSSTNDEKAESPNTKKKKNNEKTTPSNAYERAFMKVVRKATEGHALAVNAAVMSYALTCPSNRTRLGLPNGPPIEFATWSPSNQPPGSESLRTPPWKGVVLKATRRLKKRLFLTGDAFKQSHALWLEFHDTPLIQLPNVDWVLGERDGPASTAAEFERRQNETLEKARALVENEWHPRLVSAFFDPLESGALNIGGKGYADPYCYFRAASVALGSQLHGMIRKAVDELVAYFESFAAEDPIYPPALKLVPEAGDGIVDVLKAATVARSTLERVFEKLVHVFDNLDRVDVARYKAWRDAGTETPSYLAQEPPASGTSPSIRVNCEEPDVFFKSARAKIFAVLEANLRVAASNVALYEPFAGLLRQQLPTNDPAAACSSPGKYTTALSSPTPRGSFQGSTRGLGFPPRQDETSEETFSLASPRMSPAIVRKSSEEVDAFLEETSTRIGRLLETAENVAVSSQFEAAPLFEIEVHGLHGLLVDKALTQVEACLGAVSTSIRQDAKIAAKASRIAVLWLQQRPKSVQELVVAQANLERACDLDFDELQVALKQVWKQVDFLVENRAIKRDDLNAVAQASKAVAQVRDQLRSTEDQLLTDKAAFRKELDQIRDRIKDTLVSTASKTHAFAEKANAKLIREYIDQLIEARQSLADTQKDIDQLNDQERLLGASPTAFPSFVMVDAELEPYEKLWNSALQFHMAYSTWVRGPIKSLDGDTIASDHAHLVQVFGDLNQRLKNLKALEPANVANTIRAQLQRFQPNILLIQVLASPHLTQNSWTDISSVLGIHVSPDTLTNLAGFLELADSPVDKLPQLQHILHQAKLADATGGGAGGAPPSSSQQQGGDGGSPAAATSSSSSAPAPAPAPSASSSSDEQVGGGQASDPPPPSTS